MQQFQSTRPRGARHWPRGVLYFYYRFQSTRPRGARRVPPSDHIPADHVSIHAPAWGATSGRLPLLPLFGNVSIHAPAWGATSGGLFVLCREPVSIHAPAWGATRLPGGSMSFWKFQSTRPRGARPRDGAAPACRPSCFNPRARVGRDGRRRTRRRPALCFNPRARVGRDMPATSSSEDRHHVSIHAPAWGATSVGPRFLSPCNVSIHAPAWGATASS